MAVPYMLFQPEKAHCPACFSVLAGPEEVCPFCRSDFSAVTKRIPWNAPPLADILDPEGRLTGRESRKIRSHLKSFRRGFPGFRAYVCLLNLPPDIDSREFGFWYFNVAPDDGTNRARALMLVIDRTARAASVTTGYALDPIIGDMTLGKLLQDCRDLFEASAYADGVGRFLKGVGRHMRRMYGEYLSMAAKTSANAFDPPEL